MVTQCSNSFRCWECNLNCLVKQSFSLPDDVFMSMLHDSYAPNVGCMMAYGIPVKDAEEIQNIRTMSIITARKKCLEKLH